MSLEIHCEGPGCAEWTRTGAHAQDAGYVTMIRLGDMVHLCSWTCVMRYASSRLPNVAT
jgi:hypothetical protein